LLQYQRGTLASGGGSISAAITLSGTDSLRTYELDGLGNWRRTGFTPEGSSTAQTEIRQHNGLNQITRTQNGSTQTNLSYDGAAGASNGNLENDGTRTYTWDALNRLVQVNRVSDGAVIAQYSYDALSRRIRRVVSSGGLSGDIPAGTTDFLYAGLQCVEERDGSNTPTMQYVWGIYVDEIIQQTNIAAINGFGTNAVLYPLQDLLYRTTGLADAGGTVREAYDTDAYGNTLIFRNGTPPAAIGFSDSDTQVDYPTCPFIFTGQRFDPETGLYYYKRRCYHPALGRFVSRDPIGTSGGINLYEYVGDSPLARIDPEGRTFEEVPVPGLGQIGTIVTDHNSLAAGTYAGSGYLNMVKPNDLQTACNKWCVDYGFDEGKALPSGAKPFVIDVLEGPKQSGVWSAAARPETTGILFFKKNWTVVTVTESDVYDMFLVEVTPYICNCCKKKAFGGEGSVWIAGTDFDAYTTKAGPIPLSVPTKKWEQWILGSVSVDLVEAIKEVKDLVQMAE
jgi:RHS repeat-associated protein